MQETPPRRRRPPPRDDGPSLPFIPIVLGVIVLGFIIGAGLSVAGRRAPSSDVVPFATASATAASTEAATFAPVTFAPASLPPAHAKPKPIARPATHSPVPALEPSTRASVEPSPGPSPDQSPSGSSKGSAQAVESALPAPSGTVFVAPRKAVTTAPAAHVTEPPAAHVTEPPATTTPATAPPAPATAAPAAATPTTAPRDDVTSDFGRQAAGVVRAYLAAVARGDTDAAYAQLGSAPGVATGALPEIGIVTRATRIVHVEARGSETAVTVNVDMQTPSGAYFGQYTVHRSANGAAIIVQHSIFKS